MIILDDWMTMIIIMSMISIELAGALTMMMTMTTMSGLITIFMEFVGQAYVRHAGGSSVEGSVAAIIITGQPMYYPLQSPKF